MRYLLNLPLAGAVFMGGQYFYLAVVAGYAAWLINAPIELRDAFGVRYTALGALACERSSGRTAISASPADAA
jgi:hypothetical protein